MHLFRCNQWMDRKYQAFIAQHCMKNNAANLCERRIFPDGELVLAEPVAGDQLLVVRVPHDARHLVIHIQDIIDILKPLYNSFCL